MVPPRCFVEFGGAITRIEWVDMPGVFVSDEPRSEESPAQLLFDEEYHEWLDVLECVAEARGNFVMVELGAGYGRWAVRAALAAREAGLAVQCVAVEGEPTHARWLRQHFSDNGFDPNEHDLIWAAVAAESGFVPFVAGNPSTDYGQCMSAGSTRVYPSVAERRRLRARSALCRPPRVPDNEVRQIWVPSITLADVLAPYPLVDLIDLDVQGAELEVLAAGITTLDARVRRVHIGTHSEAVENGLRQLFAAHGWTLHQDFRCNSVAPTPYGEIRFGDGVQSWINHRLMTQVEERSTAYRYRERIQGLKAKLASVRAERDRLRGIVRQLTGPQREETIGDASRTE
jgi:FkbM family methyltransferase